MAKKTTLAEFESIFPKLEEDLVAQALQYTLPQGELDWYKKVSYLVTAISDRLAGGPILD